MCVMSVHRWLYIYRGRVFDWRIHKLKQSKPELGTSYCSQLYLFLSWWEVDHHLLESAHELGIIGSMVDAGTTVGGGPWDRGNSLAFHLGGLTSIQHWCVTMTKHLRNRQYHYTTLTLIIHQTLGARNILKSMLLLYTTMWCSLPTPSWGFWSSC